jgi:hypothetical protein
MVTTLTVVTFTEGSVFAEGAGFRCGGGGKASTGLGDAPPPSVRVHQSTSEFESDALSHLVAGFLTLSQPSANSRKEGRKSATEWLWPCRT